MKKFYIFIIVFTGSAFINAFTQPTTNIPQYTLEAKNFNLVNSYNMTFDLVFTHTDAIPLQLAGWMFFYRIPVGIGTLGFLTGANSSFQYDSTGGDAISDLPVGFRPRNASVANSGGTHYELRTAANTLPGAGGGLILQQGVPILIGRYKMKSTTPIDVSALSTFIIRDSCEVPLSVTRTKINFYNENSFNQEITRCTNHSVSITVSSFITVHLNLKFLIEGLYNVDTDKLFKRESSTVFLRNAFSPYEKVDSSNSILDSLNFTGEFTFLNISPLFNYYIVVKTKNGLETWSKSGGQYFVNGNNSYDFTKADSQAFGNNMVLKGSRYCIYSGNVNNDQIIDSDDLVMIDNDLYNYTFGNVATNLNGDNIVDIDDLAIADKNASELILVEWPGLTSDKKNELRNLQKNKFVLQ